MAKRIFILTSSHQYQWRYRGMLEWSGYIVRGAVEYIASSWHYSAELVQQVITFQPRLILCILPGPYTYEEVFQLLQVIRDSFELNQGPLYFMLCTQYFSPDTPRPEIIDLYMTYPPDSTDLVNKIKQLLQDKADPQLRKEPIVTIPRVDYQMHTRNPIDDSLPQPQNPMTWEAYQALSKELGRAISERSDFRNGYTGIPRYFNEKVYLEIPERYRARLPVYLLARCPLCGGRVYEAVDTFSLEGIGWWHDEPTGFGWFGRKCNVDNFKYGPPARPGSNADMIPRSSYTAECECVLGLTYGVNFNGILPDDVGGVFVGSEKAGVLKRFMAQEGSYAVIHALGLGRYDELPEWQSRYTVYFISYFNQDKEAYKRSFLPIDFRNSKKFYWPYNDLDYDILSWVEAGKLLWLDPTVPGLPLRQGSAAEFPYPNLLVGLEGRWYVGKYTDLRIWQQPGGRRYGFRRFPQEMMGNDLFSHFNAYGNHPITGEKNYDYDLLAEEEVVKRGFQRLTK